MIDFTCLAYDSLLVGLTKLNITFKLTLDLYKKNCYSFTSIRHDIDAKPLNALNFAKIEKSQGIVGSYYFRSCTIKSHIVKTIADFGHEIGYHYEDLALCKGNMDEAIKSFEKNLNYFRQFYPVKTICMHGSPLSKYDNRKLWEKYDYRDFGIVTEPYFDVDYSKVLYLTDTGRRWDGNEVSVRDKVWNKGRGTRDKSFIEGTRDEGRGTSRDQGLGIRDQEKSLIQDRWSVKLNPGEKGVYRDENGILRHNFHSTFDIIKAAEENKLPDQIMITVHPQRWTNNPILWTKELVMQNVKNQVKKIIVKRKL